MTLKYQNLIRGLSLFFFFSGIIVAFFNSTGILASVLSGTFLYFYEKSMYIVNKKADAEQTIVDLSNKIEAIEKELNDIKNDHSLAHLAATFKRK